MDLSFLTPELFDILVIVMIILGLALAAVRLYDDLTRPLPPTPRSSGFDDDTQPNPALSQPDTPEPQGD